MRGFGQGVVRAIGVAGVGQQLAQGQLMGPQALLQVGEQAGQVEAVGQIGLHVADDALGQVHGQAAAVVQGPGFAGLEGNARVGSVGL